MNELQQALLNVSALLALATFSCWSLCRFVAAVRMLLDVSNGGTDLGTRAKTADLTSSDARNRRRG